MMTWNHLEAACEVHKGVNLSLGREETSNQELTEAFKSSESVGKFIDIK